MTYFFVSGILLITIKIENENINITYHTKYRNKINIIELIY